MKSIYRFSTIGIVPVSSVMATSFVMELEPSDLLVVQSFIEKMRASSDSRYDCVIDKIGGEMNIAVDTDLADDVIILPVDLYKSYSDNAIIYRTPITSSDNVVKISKYNVGWNENSSSYMPTVTVSRNLATKLKCDYLFDTVTYLSIPEIPERDTSKINRKTMSTIYTPDELVNIFGGLNDNE